MSLAFVVIFLELVMLITVVPSSFILIPVFPSNVKAPPLVVRLDAAPASIATPEDVSISNPPELFNFNASLSVLADCKYILPFPICNNLLLLKFNPIPPCGAVKNILPSLNEPVVVPTVLFILILSVAPLATSKSILL